MQPLVLSDRYRNNDLFEFMVPFVNIFVFCRFGFYRTHVGGFPQCLFVIDWLIGFDKEHLRLWLDDEIRIQNFLLALPSIMFWHLTFWISCAVPTNAVFYRIVLLLLQYRNKNNYFSRLWFVQWKTLVRPVNSSLRLITPLLANLSLNKAGSCFLFTTRIMKIIEEMATFSCDKRSGKMVASIQYLYADSGQTLSTVRVCTTVHVWQLTFLTYIKAFMPC